MLATFVIGLREGLEAALIVGIIAAFLRQNGRSLSAMWLGVGLALVLSFAVGVTLDLVEHALPQAAQEGMETVIGALAVVFVTGMIAWMNTHARGMKRRLEHEAAAAIGDSRSVALAAMAFLAVLREGFETAVFLLATFSAAQSERLAAFGAVLGILCAVAIGWGIYKGGVVINLGRFFRLTGAFLILVAAGLVVTMCRTAHEAGWLNAGQQMTVHLTWLVAPGTVRSALITGVLGIPADPRLVELLGWFAYLVPVSLYVYWPQRLRPTPHLARALRMLLGGAMMLAAALLALLYPSPTAQLAQAAPLASGGSVHLVRTGTDHEQALVLNADGAPEQRIALPPGQSTTASHAALDTRYWHTATRFAPGEAPATLSVDALLALTGGRIPVGLNPRLHPGPYAAHWQIDSATDVWLAQGALLDAHADLDTILTLSGGGLTSPRTITIPTPAWVGHKAWAVSPAYVTQASATFAALPAARAERGFWAVFLPLLLGLAGLALLLLAIRGRVTQPQTRLPVPSRHAMLSHKERSHAAE